MLEVANRPGFSPNACTVAPDRVEIENDYTNSITTGTYAAIVATYPQTLVIFGTSDPHLDVEIGPLATNHSSAGGRPIDGASDLELSAKYELGLHSNVVWGVEGTVTIPSGAPAFTYGNAQFLGDLNWDYEIDSTYALSGTFSFRAASAVTPAGTARSYFAFVPSVELIALLPGHRSQVSAEYAYFSRAGPNLGARSYVDFAYQRDLGPNLEVEAEYGLAPTLVDGGTERYLEGGLTLLF